MDAREARARSPPRSRAAAATSPRARGSSPRRSSRRRPRPSAGPPRGSAARSSAKLSPVSPGEQIEPLARLAVKAFTAPLNRLSLMFSRWPRKRSQGPAGEMWSVVHLPFALSSSGRSTKSAPSQAGKGVRRWSRSLSGETSTRPLRRSRGGASVAGLAHHEAARGDLGRRGRRRELEALAVPALELVAQRIEREATRERVGHHDLGAADERIGARIAVVAALEVPVVGVEDRVRVAFLHVVALPLADAGAAGVREHGGAHRLEVRELSVAPDRLVDLLGARRHPQLRLGARAVRARLARDVGGALQILVGGVRAAPDQRRAQTVRIAVLLHVGRQLARRAARGRACAARRRGARARRDRSRSPARRSARGAPRPRDRRAAAPRAPARASRSPRGRSPPR